VFNACGKDLIVFSYALSMFDPGRGSAIEVSLHRPLGCGLIGVVDSHATRFDWFGKWMGCNQVRMGVHLSRTLRPRSATLLVGSAAGVGRSQQLAHFPRMAAIKGEANPAVW
jgi:S-adenosylmethionine-diacylgycerolhomoserine-N-methlytransferase